MSAYLDPIEDGERRGTKSRSHARATVGREQENGPADSTVGARFQPGQGSSLVRLHLTLVLRRPGTGRQAGTGI